MTEPPTFEEYLSSADPAEIRDLQRRNAQLEKQLERYRSGDRIIRETIREIFSTHAPLRIPAPPRVSRSKQREVAVLHLSDTQIGKVTSSYSTDVAEARILELGRKAVRITQVRRMAAAIDEIRLYLGGDLVEGEDIFPHQAHMIDVPLIEQAVKRGPAVLVRLVLYLLTHFHRVKVLSVPGNHGRNGSKGTRSHPATNWDTIVAEVARGMLLGPEDVPRKELAGRLEFSISPSFYLVDRMPGDWGNLLVHGHQVNGGFGGFPFYGVGKKIAGWADSIHEPWDYLWFGHFHTYGSLVINHRLWLANGTVESDNEFAREQIASQNKPCQRLAFFDAEHGLIADHQVFLDDRLPQARRFIHGG